MAKKICILEDAYSSYHGRVHDSTLAITPEYSSEGTAQMTAAYAGHIEIDTSADLEDFKKRLDGLCFFKDSD